MKQKVKVFSERDPLDPTIIEMEVPSGTKILSNEPYAKELYDMYENSGSIQDIAYQELDDGDVVTAIVSSVKENEVNLDVNWKHSVSMPLDKDERKFLEYFQVGSAIDVKVKNRASKITVSFNDALNDKKYDDIKSNIDKPVAYKATVKELIHGGYLLKIDTIDVFMPGSLAGMNKLWNFDELIGQEIIVMPVNYEKNMIVVSRRKYLKTLVSAAISNIKDNVNDEYEGFVTGATKFGVFAEFNTCVTGLIPLMELNKEYKALFDARSIKPGDKIKFYIKDIVHDYKVILTQLEKNPWKDVEQKFKPFDKIRGKVRKITNYGLFVEIYEGVYSLLHSSEIKDMKKYSEGDKINVIIDKIDIQNKKISLKLGK